MTGKRRSGRELAFRLLFQADVGGLPLDEVFALARESSDSGTDSWEFATGLARGAWERRKELDPHITRYAAGWTLERMANADRNLLRMALYEMLYRTDIPQSVSINEAVELSKRYSTQESARFINGILGSFVRDHGTDGSTLPKTKAPKPTATKASEEEPSSAETPPSEEATSSNEAAPSIEEPPSEELPAREESLSSEPNSAKSPSSDEVPSSDEAPHESSEGEISTSDNEHQVPVEAHSTQHE